MAKVKARIAAAEEKTAKELLKTTEARISHYEKLNYGKGKEPLIAWEEMANLRLTRDKYYQETIQKQGAVELSQLEVRYREWQYRRVEAAIKRLKAAKEK